MDRIKFLFSSTFYPPHHLGGDAIHVKYLAEELARIGHEVHVFHSLDAYNLKKRKPVEEKHRHQVHVHNIQTGLNSSSYAAYLLGNSSYVVKKFGAIIKEIEPDVVHHHNISLLGYSLLRKQANYLNLYTAHDYWLICQMNSLLKGGLELCENPECLFCCLKCKRPPQLWRHRKEFNNAIKEIDILITPSDFMKEKLRRNLSINPITIPNFVPRPPHEFGPPSGLSNFFLYAGVIEKHKGILNLVDLFEKHKIGSKLIIVGKGSLERTISHHIEKNNLTNRISLLGWVKTEFLYRLLKEANALIVPSIWPENSPLITLEAISVGTPVIASNKGGLPEIVGRISKNLIFNNWAELKDILTSFSREDFSSQRIKRCYKRYFSPESYLATYLKLIETATHSIFTKDISFNC